MIPSPNQMAAIGALGLSVVAFGLGGALAWEWQGSKIEQCEREFNDYVVEQNRILNKHKIDAATNRQETSDAWAQNLEALRAANAGEFASYKRCVAAGRCGAVVIDRVREQTPVPGSSGGAIQPTEPANETSSDAVSLAAECSETTLQINMLQADICKQPGMEGSKLCHT